MGDTPGVVVVGTGFGCLTHVRALRAAGFDVKALVGRDPARTKERAERFAVPVASTSLAEALTVPDVDAVAIATPPMTHAALALQAIEAGKHLVCEKPFARDAAEARTVHAAVEAAGVVHLLGCEFRYAPGQALMTRLVRDGAIGVPRLATFLLHIPMLAAGGSEVPEWWSRAEEGGGWLGAQGSHTIDQIRSMLGEVAGVSGQLLTLGENSWTAEDTFTVRFTTRDGCEGVLQSTAADRGPFLISSRVAGTRGTVWAEGDRVRVADASGTRDIPVPDDLVIAPADPPPAELLTTAYDLLHSTGMDMGPYTRLFEVFRDLIAGVPLGTRPAPATFADGVAAMTVVDAIRRSAAETTWVSV